MRLKIGFVSQQGNAARNDCGAACVAMCASNALAAVPVDEVLTRIEQPQNKPLAFSDLYEALGVYGLSFEYVRPLHLPDLRRWLANGNPVIALVGYGELPAGQKAQPDFDDAHFVVVVGFGRDVFYVHDPLWPDARGAYRAWPVEVMGAALARPGWGNMPLQGVVVYGLAGRPYVIVEPEMGELGLAVNAALSSGVAMSYLEQIYNALGVGPGPLAERQGHALAKIVK